MNAIQFSKFKKGLLAGCDEQGSIYLWDLNGSPENCHVFKNAHLSPATCLAFSPFNRMLLCSAGLDKKIILIDVEKKSYGKGIICRIVKSVSVPSSISSLSFRADGITIAAGSINGHIYCYDLRNTIKPVMSTQPSSAPCKNLLFENRIGISSRRESQVPKEESSEALKKSLETLKNLEISKGSLEKDNLVPKSLLENVFSVKKDDAGIFKDKFKEPPTFSPIQANKERLLKHEKSVLSMFSPLKSSKTTSAKPIGMIDEFPSFVEDKTMLKPVSADSAPKSNFFSDMSFKPKESEESRKEVAKC